MHAGIFMHLHRAISSKQVNDAALAIPKYLDFNMACTSYQLFHEDGANPKGSLRFSDGRSSSSVQVRVVHDRTPTHG